MIAQAAEYRMIYCVYINLIISLVINRLTEVTSFYDMLRIIIELCILQTV